MDCGHMPVVDVVDMVHVAENTGSDRTYFLFTVFSSARVPAWLCQQAKSSAPNLAPA